MFLDNFFHMNILHYSKYQLFNFIPIIFPFVHFFSHVASGFWCMINDYVNPDFLLKNRNFLIMKRKSYSHVLQQYKYIV